MRAPAKPAILSQAAGRHSKILRTEKPGAGFCANAAMAVTLSDGRRGTIRQSSTQDSEPPWNNCISPRRHLSGAIKLPGSKSISNRTLLLAALGNGSTLVRELLDSDDIRHMLAALKLLGVEIEQIGDSRDFRVQGVGGEFPVKNADLFLGNAGTAFRPLTAALALMQGHYQLSGVPRMHERPIGDLVDALRVAGAQIQYQGNTGFRR